MWKVACGTDPKVQRHSPGGQCVWGKPLPPESRPLGARAARRPGRRPLLRRGLCRWSPRRRRNMAPRAAPSCRLVFCLLISAAALRPGEQGPRSSPRPPWAGHFRRFAARRVGLGVGGRRWRHRAGPASVTCASLGSAGWLKFGQRLGALGKPPGTLGAAGGPGLQGPGQDSGALPFPLRPPPGRGALAL